MLRKANFEELKDFHSFELKDYENFDVDNDFVYLHEKIGMNIIIPNMHHCKCIDHKQDRIILKIYHRDCDVTGKLGIKFAGPFGETDYSLGNFYFEKGIPTFKKAYEGQTEGVNHILIKVGHGYFIPKEELQKKGIKFFKRDKSRGTSFFVFPVSKDTVNLHNEIYADFYEDLEKKFEKERAKYLSKYKIDKDVANFVMEELPDFLESYKKIVERFGFGEIKIKLRDLDPEFDGEAKGTSFRFRIDFWEGEKTLYLNGFFSEKSYDYCFNIPNNKEELKQRLSQFLKDEEESFEEALKRESEIITPLVKLSEERGLNLVKLEDHKVSYRDTCSYDYFSDNDPHDEGWVEYTYVKTSFITKDVCRDIQSLFKNVK